MKKRSIAVVAGGTAGHVFPAQAVTEILQTKNNVIFFTDNRGSRFFTDKQCFSKLYIKNVTGNIFKKIQSLFCLGISTLKALYLLKKHRVKLAIGFGGLTSFPVLFAAKILNIPIIIHEQNAVLGKANKFFVKSAKFLATSFEKTIGVNDREYKVIHTGMPIREKVFETKRRRTRITKDIFLVVIGGSQGSEIFDKTIADAIIKLPNEVLENITLFQQVRKENHDLVKKIYSHSKIKSFHLQSFFDNIAQLMIDSDLIISRAGASTLFETEHLKVPTIIVPMALSADNHQLQNAQEFFKLGFSKVIEEKDFSETILYEILSDLFIKNDIDNMRAAVQNANVNNSAQKLAIKINEVIISMRL